MMGNVHFASQKSCVDLRSVTPIKSDQHSDSAVDWSCSIADIQSFRNQADIVNGFAERLFYITLSAIFFLTSPERFSTQAVNTIA